MDDPVGADHARVADVDHVRVRHVEPDAEADEEHERDRQPGDGHEQAQRLGPPAAARDEQHAHQQVDEQRIDQRRREADPRRVEERERDGEAEQREQVEVQPREAPQPAAAQVRQERRDEQQAHRDPHVPGVHAPAERAVVAARHRPRDLVAGPRLQHRAAGVVDRHLADLPPVSRGEDRHLPLRRALRVRGRVGARMLAQDAFDLRHELRDRDRSARRESVAGRRDHGARRRHERVGVGRGRGHGRRDGRRAGGGRDRRRGQLGRRRGAREQRREQQDRRGDPRRGAAHGRKLQSFWPRNDSGVAVTIAIACASTSRTPAASTSSSSIR